MCTPQAVDGKERKRENIGLAAMGEEKKSPDVYYIGKIKES